MSSQPQPNGRAVAAGASLVVVCVEDSIDPKLTGRTGGAYQSPPQTPEQAMALVRLLLGGHGHQPNGESRWATDRQRRATLTG